MEERSLILPDASHQALSDYRDAIRGAEPSGPPSYRREEKEWKSGMSKGEGTPEDGLALLASPKEKV